MQVQGIEQKMAIFIYHSSTASQNLPKTPEIYRTQNEINKLNLKDFSKDYKILQI